MSTVARILTRSAEFYARNPNALSEGRHLAAVLAEAGVGGEAIEAIEAVREHLGMAGVVGSLGVWSQKHTAAEAAELLKKVAAEVSP